MFDSWFDNNQQKARPIAELEAAFAQGGSAAVNAACGDVEPFTAEQWAAFSEKEKSAVLMQYRIAYQGETAVNWCPALGTVLANDEVKEGYSVRGGHPVEQKKMTQWQLRVSAYAGRLLEDLEDLDWTDSLKDMQRNWIGKSQGAEMNFKVSDGTEEYDMTIFTTRADTVFGVTFMVLAPESEWVEKLTTAEQKEAVEEYLLQAKKKTERERMTETKKVSGVFSGSYAVNPLTGDKVPVWISEYVLAGYGTGAIMAVPAHDSRDYAFAKHFNLPVVPLIEGCDVSESSFDAKEGIMCNSGFLNGLTVKEAIPAAIDYVEKHGIGHRKVNYRLRDAIFSRQRYWGEPFPVYFKDGIATPMSLDQLPLQLPEVDKFLPTETGEPPLGRAAGWTIDGYPIELSTMPGFAGSSAYYLRYMDPHNSEALVSTEADEYWRDVDLYIGGTEHATGHLIYSRFWNKFLFDLGYVCEKEPFKKLINQGMIQGRSNFVYRIINTNTFVSLGLKDQYETTEIHVDVNIVRNDRLDLEAFKAWMPDFANAEFILEDGEYICGWAVEKMSKSMFNVVNPDLICDTYGADTLRLYEMFLGPLEQSKPWDTKGIDGVNRFLRKVWRLFYDRDNFLVTDEKATPEELKALHKLIGKVRSDIEAFSFNTAVSAFMIAVNELTDLKCNKREILEQLIVLLAPFTPHIAEELWEALGHKESITYAAFPEYIEAYTIENTCTYAVSFNGKTRFTVDLPLDMSREDVDAHVRSLEQTAKYVAGGNIVKVIVVPGKIVNIVVK
jgi:leucyl-tRNA synthetase